jgi:hypothetical protein
MRTEKNTNLTEFLRSYVVLHHAATNLSSSVWASVTPSQIDSNMTAILIRTLCVMEITLTNKLTNSMELSTTREATRC